MEKGLERTRFPFDEIKIADSDTPAFRIEESSESVGLSPNEFRLLIFLKKAKGNIVTHQEMADILFGEPEGDLPMSETIDVQIHYLRRKLELASHRRFSIGSWARMGWYLTDTEHPELLYTDNPHRKAGRKPKNA
jgi:DNA-binding response OmpR family regulator